MAYIYQIVNDINGKIYVGKTERSIEIRFKEHCKDINRRGFENRPLYRAMNKYGIEHFHIELLEETDNPEEREIYWIEKLGSFKNGYNATIGGDGKKYLDYDLIIKTYLEVKNVAEAARILNIDYSHALKIIHSYNLPSLWTVESAKDKYGKPCAMINKDGNIEKTFSTITDAAKLIKQEQQLVAKEDHIRTCIGRVCGGKRKTAYGYYWKFL